MREKKTSCVRVLSIVMSVLMTLSVITFPTLKTKAAGTVDDFVERCYTVTLDRPSDADGFADWKGKLLNGQAVGIEVAYGFIFSPEYTKKNKSNEDYVTDLYALFLGREPDKDGYNDWVGQLNQGKSKLEVFAGFANSQEFFDLCESYGITTGRYVVGYDRTSVNNVNLFVERLYKVCLGRRGDKGGQNNWVEKLLKKEISGSECARSFIFSQEYTNKNLSNEEFVENLYLAMMGRPSDADGKENWLNALASGKTKDEVFAGFANSQEFAQLCANYKIDNGAYTPKDISNPSDNSEPVSYGYRVSRKDLIYGDYILVNYGEGNGLVSEIRYNKDGAYLGYDYRGEINHDTNEFYYGIKFYDDNGVGQPGYYSKTVNSSDMKLETEYEYSDEWKTLSSYSVYEKEECPVKDENGYPYSIYLPHKRTEYDAEGNIINTWIYEYDDNNRETSRKEYSADGKLTWSNEVEYYGLSNIEKKSASKTYNSDGSLNFADIHENNENNQIVKQTVYNNGVLDEYYIHEYDSKGNQVKMTCYNNSDEIKWYQTGEYDENGNCIKYTLYERDFYEVTVCKYDSNGNCLSKETTNSSNFVLMEEKWNYNTNGDMTYHYIGYTSSNPIEEIYEYDQNNLKTKYTKKENGNVVFWEKYTYEKYAF